MPGVYLLRDKESARSGESRTRSSLDKRTLTGEKRKLPRPERVLCVTDLSKVGVVEVGWSQAGCKGSHGIKGKGRNKEENAKRAQARARRQVRKACLNIGALYILTLTYHENMQDREQAIYHRQEFDRRMKKHYGGWAYVGVLEAQKRGALHWHLAVPVRVDQAIALKEWREVTGDHTITQVHVGFEPNGKGNAFVKCAHYVSKYIGKEMNQRGIEEHRYHIGRGMLPEVQRVYMRAGRIQGMQAEVRVALEVVFHLLGENVTIWQAPVMEGKQYGFLRGQVSQLQKEDG